MKDDLSNSGMGDGMSDQLRDIPATPEARPWTPGPWRAETSPWGEVVIVDASGSQVATGRPTMYADATPTVELIALAPEMAEAILYVVELFENGDAKWCNQILSDMATKLRAIGAPND